MNAMNARAAILELLAKRGTGKTICPSEVARMLAAPQGNWRDNMAQVHRAVDELVASETIELSWKGERLDRRRGAYRIARRQPEH